MYKHIPEFGDEEDHPIWKSGIAGIVSHARKFCQPQWHGFDVWAETSDMFALSSAAQIIEDRFNAEMEREAKESGDEFIATRGNALRLICGMSDAVVSDLPPPYRDCVPDNEQGPDGNPFGRFSDNPLAIMVLAAQSLASADEAAECFSRGDFINAMERLDRAAVSLAHAAECSGMQEAERNARKVQAQLRAERSAQGGKARGDKYAVVRAWVAEQYRDGEWPSLRQAALALSSKAAEMSRSVGQPLSEDRAFQTVYDWLRADARSR